MKNNIKIMLLSMTLLMTLVLTACGNLSDPDSIWNQTREAEIEDTATGAAAGAMTFTPGTFAGTSQIRGYNGLISVSVTINDSGHIAEIEVTDHRESDGFYQRAFDALIPLILEVQSAHVAVDAASGATYTAEAFISAVNDALSLAGGVLEESAPAARANFTPGVFQAEGIRGYNGPITVSVTIDDDGNIAKIEVIDHRESDGFYQRAFDALIPLILDAQSLDVNIDAASGATYTANALLDAIGNALNDAE